MTMFSPQNQEMFYGRAWPKTSDVLPDGKEQIRRSFAHVKNEG